MNKGQFQSFDEDSADFDAALSQMLPGDKNTIITPVEEETKEEVVEVSIEDTFDEDLDRIIAETDEDNEDGEEKKRKKTAEKKEVVKNTEEEPIDSSPLKEYANTFIKLGVLDEEFLPESIDEDNLQEALELTIDKKAKEAIEEIVGKYGPEYEKAFIDIFVRGANPKEYFNTLNQKSEIDTTDIATTDGQRAIMKQYLQLTSPDSTDEEINDMIDDYEMMDKLESRATKAKDYVDKHLSKRQEHLAKSSEQQRIDNEKAIASYRNELVNTVDSIIKEGSLDNIPFTKKDEALVDYIADYKFKLQNGTVINEFTKDIFEIQNDPKKLMKLAKFIKSGMSTEKIIKEAVSNTKSKIFSDLPAIATNSRGAKLVTKKSGYFD